MSGVAFSRPRIKLLSEGVLVGSVCCLDFEGAGVEVAIQDGCGIITIPGGGTNPGFGPIRETFFGPADHVTLGNTPLEQLVVKNQIEQHPVGGVPGEGEYAISGNVITIDLGPGDRLDVYEFVIFAPTYETFTGPAASVTLGSAYSLIIAAKNGLGQHNDGSGIAEGNYKLVGTTLTVDLGPGDVLDVFGFTALPPSYETFTGPSANETLAITPSQFLAVKDGAFLAPVPIVTEFGECHLFGDMLTTELPGGSLLDVYEWV